MSSTADGEVAAGWTASAGVIVDDVGPTCWEGDEQCDVACNDDLVAELQISLSEN